MFFNIKNLFIKSHSEKLNPETKPYNKTIVSKGYNYGYNYSNYGYQDSPPKKLNNSQQINLDKEVDKPKTALNPNNHKEVKNSGLTSNFQIYQSKKSYIILEKDYNKAKENTQAFILDNIDNLYSQTRKTQIDLNKSKLLFYSSSKEFKDLLEKKIGFQLVNEEFLKKIKIQESDFKGKGVFSYEIGQKRYLLFPNEANTLIEYDNIDKSFLEPNKLNKNENQKFIAFNIDETKISINYIPQENKNEINEKEDKTMAINFLYKKFKKFILLELKALKLRV